MASRRESTLTVREFDRIFMESNKPDGSRLTLPDGQFHELEEYMREVQSVDGEEALASRFLKPGSFRHCQYISAQNYVGVIELKSGRRIEILPKVFFPDGGSGKGGDLEGRTRQVFLTMLQSLPDFDGQHFVDAMLDVKRLDIFEVFIRLYIREAMELAKRGLRSSYVTQEENLALFKGKLLLSEHIRHNAAHAERFYVAYDEFHPNIAVNRIVKATLEKLLRKTRHASTSREIVRLLGMFEGVKASTSYEADFAQIHLDRTTRRYESLINWARVFLLNKSFTPFAGASSARALLFPMETVYEAYVYRCVRRVFGAAGWKAAAQGRGESMYLVRDEKAKKNRFKLKPDIIIEKDGRRIVLDTKWKNLTTNQKEKYGISQSDMYQMYAYSKRFKTPEVWLLYPLNEEVSAWERPSEEIRFLETDGQTRISAFFVSFDERGRIEEGIKGLHDMICAGP